MKKLLWPLEKKVDKLWSECIRKVWKCEYCWKTEYLNAHHIFSRNNKSVRWELINGICLCSGCHTFSSKFSAHQTPTEFTIWLENKRWRVYLDQLQSLAHIPLKITQDYLEEKIKYLKRYIEEY